MEKIVYQNNGVTYSYRRIEEKKSQLDTADLKTVCFTGHRPKSLYGYVPINRYQPIIDKLALAVKKSYEDGYRKFISGGAQGIDQLAFMAVHLARNRYNLNGIVNALYIPFNGFESRWAEFGTFSKEYFYELLYEADVVRIVSERYSPMSPYYDIVKALDERNKEMLRSSSKLIAWYNGVSKGGTLNCIKDALMLGIEVENLYPL